MIEDTQVVANESTTIDILPIILIGVALCAALCGGDDGSIPG